MIRVVDFGPDQCFGDSEIHGCLINEDGEIDYFWDRHSGRWRVVFGKVLYQVGIVFVHDPNLLGDPMHLTVKVF